MQAVEVINGGSQVVQLNGFKRTPHGSDALNGTRPQDNGVSNAIPMFEIKHLCSVNLL